MEHDFDKFFREQYRPLVVLLDRVSGGVESAEDLAQEAMTRAAAAWTDLADHPNREAWVRRVGINLAMTGHRRAKRQRSAFGRLYAVPEAQPDVSAHPDDPLVDDAIRSLPLQQRAAVALHYLEDRPVSEIAEMMGCAPATARVHLHRGRRALYAALGSSLDNDDPPVHRSAAGAVTKEP